MKKLLTIVVAAALVCAAAAQAQAALETSGEYRARGFWFDNYVSSQIPEGTDRSTEWWDQRLRLHGKWAMGEKAGVAFRADILEGFWGDKFVGFDTLGNPVESSTKDQIAFDRLWGWVTVPNTPVTITMGRQEVHWGTGAFVGADNRDRLKVTAKFDPVTVGVLYEKFKETHLSDQSGDYDDRNGYAALAVANVGGWNTGIIAYYLLDGSQDKDKEFDYFNVDIYGMGKAGPVEIKAEGSYLVGKDDIKDIDLSAWGVYAGAFIPVGPVKIGAEGAAVSGDDPGTRDENEGAARMDYNGPYWSIVLFNNLDYNGYRNESDFSGDTSVGNAWSLKASATVPLGPVSLYAAALYAARFETIANIDEDMGTEFDVVASLPLGDGITATAGVGYLIPGGYFDKTGRGGDDPANALATMVGLNFKF